MFALFLGRTGSGKSYELTNFHVIPALQSGRMVVTNLPLNIEWIYQAIPEARGLIKIISPSKLNPRPFSSVTDYLHEWRHPDTNQGPLIAIDEAHKALPKGKTSIDVLEFMAESRHAGVDIYFATQGTRKIDQNVIDLVDITYRFTKARAAGSDKRYIRKVIDGVRGEVMNTTFRTYRPELFKFYQSHTMSNKAITESTANDIKPLWQHWTIIGSGLCFAYVVFAGFNGWLNPFRSAEATTEKQSTVQPVLQQKPSEMIAMTPEPINEPEQNIKSKPQPELQAKQTDESKIGHPYSKVNFHVSGSLFNAKHTVALITASQNGQPVFYLNTDELIKAGYEIKFVADCAINIKYPKTGYDENITCNMPTVGLRVASVSSE